MDTIEERFQPDLTPAEMKRLGVLAAQYFHADPEEHNFFHVDASLKKWPKEWIDSKAPHGWFEWYMKYSKGVRTPDDERQMKRWISFKARHMAQLLKADPTGEDLSIQPRRRQALLNWGIAPGGKNKYLEKVAGFFTRETRQDIINKEKERNPYIYLFHGSHLQDHIRDRGMFLDEAMKETSDRVMYDRLKDTGRMEPHFNLTSVKDYARLYTIPKGKPHWSEGKTDPLLVRVKSDKLRLNEGNLKVLNLVFRVPENDEWWYHGDISKEDIIHPNSPEYSRLISENKYLRG